MSTTTAIRLPLTVYYDGSCGLCRSEIENIIARDHRGELIMVDCSVADFDDAALPCTQAQMMNVICAVDASGAWIRGVEVFIAAYQSANITWVSRILATPRIRPLAERAYPWLVRNRYLIASLGLHRVLNFFTHRAVNARVQNAQSSFAASQQCAANACATRETKGQG